MACVCGVSPMSAALRERDNIVCTWCRDKFWPTWKPWTQTGLESTWWDAKARWVSTVSVASEKQWASTISVASEKKKLLLTLFFLFLSLCFLLLYSLCCKEKVERVQLTVKFIFACCMFWLDSWNSPMINKTNPQILGCLFQGLIIYCVLGCFAIQCILQSLVPDVCLIWHQHFWCNVKCSFLLGSTLIFASVELRPQHENT